MIMNDEQRWMMQIMEMIMKDDGLTGVGNLAEMVADGLISEMNARQI